MNKKEFLKELEKRLKPLSDEERKDICNEYEDIIDEKVKHGKTEEEAVKEFGNIASLTEEILKSYKINPKYQSKTDDFIEDCENFIKKGAKKLSDVTEEIVDGFKKSDAETTLENIFEIIIKVFILLIVIAVIHIPFWLIGELGMVPLTRFTIFGSMTSYSKVFGVLWKVFAEVAYIIVCILIFIAFFKKYITPSSNLEKKKTNKTSKVDTSSKKETKKNEIEKKVVVKEKNQSQDTLSKLLIILLKIWIAFLAILPLACIEFGLIVAVCVVLYFLVKGVEAYGIMILLVGVSLFVGHLLNVLTKAIFTKKKFCFWPFIVSLIMIIIGSIFTIDYLFSFTYHDDLKDSGYHLEKIENTIKIEDSLDTYYDEVEVDETLEDNIVKYEVTYYSDFIEIDFKKYEEKEYNDSIINTNYYVHNKIIDKHSINDLLDETIIKNLKEKKVYDYSSLFAPNIKIIVNSKTLSKID